MSTRTIQQGAAQAAEQLAGILEGYGHRQAASKLRELDADVAEAVASGGAATAGEPVDPGEVAADFLQVAAQSLRVAGFGGLGTIVVRAGSLVEQAIRQAMQVELRGERIVAEPVFMPGTGGSA